MGLLGRLGTLAEGMFNSSNPYGMALLTTTGIINRTEVELRNNKELIEALSISLATTNAKHIDEDIKRLFYSDMLENLSGKSANFYEIAINWCLTTYISYVKFGNPVNLSTEEKSKVINGVLTAIQRHWDDTFYLKRTLQPFPIDTE